MNARGAALLLALALFAPARAHAAELLDLRHWSYDNYTRVVIELSAPVQTGVQRLQADSRAGLPERLYLDLPGVRLGEKWNKPIPVGDGLLRQVRFGQFNPDTARMVIDLQRYTRHRLVRLSGPERIVVDVFANPVAQADAGDSTAVPWALPVALRPVQIVVIDPGHGGEDPGAIGVGGLREKDVTLSVSLELRRYLQQRGFEVVMTRERDVGVSLEERTAIAAAWDGDVFISIHANAAERSSLRGIETYYLDKSNERHTLRVAARESGVASPSALDPLQRAVAGMRISEVSQHSAALASAVHEPVIAEMRKIYRPADAVRDLGVKRGPFHVLFLASAPAILVEMGFLTNREEARRLRSNFYRRVLAERMARGIARYRSERIASLAQEAR